MSDLKSKSKRSHWRLFRRSMRVIAPYSLEECHDKIEIMNFSLPRNRYDFVDRVKAETKWIDQNHFQFSIIFFADPDSKDAPISFVGYCKQWDNASAILVGSAKTAWRPLPSTFLFFVFIAIIATLLSIVFDLLSGEFNITQLINNLMQGAPYLLGISFLFGYCYWFVNLFNIEIALAIMYDTFGRDDFEQPPTD